MRRTMMLELDVDEYRRLYLLLTHGIKEFREGDNEYEAFRHEQLFEKLKEAARRAWGPA